MSKNSTVKYVSRDLIESYERRTGFIGLGAFLEEEGVLRITLDEQEQHNPHMFSQVGRHGNAMGGNYINRSASQKEFPHPEVV